MTRRLTAEEREIAEVANATLSMQEYQRQQARERHERDLRRAEHDAAYRRALGIDIVAPLPKSLGTAGGTRSASYTGLRGTKRPVA